MPTTAMRIGMKYAALSRPAKTGLFLGFAILVGAFVGVTSMPTPRESPAAALEAQQHREAEALRLKVLGEIRAARQKQADQQQLMNWLTGR